ncbi:uncharacterized protein K02A2.6-like [Anneissia japonica]|uniref:uncharacterized protein K02A2.6-like n=1 Tax=Anneissia japonica TaxID=1529436 RepID=UPI0014255278|nr:uncharacterized protein K02A2.6-like [Anneissia japonica]
MHKTSSAAVINFLKVDFARFGIPETVITDNGPQFLGEFRQSAQDYNFEHVTVSPYHAQANGQAEKAVHISKNILKQTDYISALMAYRSTPIPSLGLSPSVLLMGREIRTTLPQLHVKLKPYTPNQKDIRVADKSYKRKGEVYYNSKYGARNLKELKPGDKEKIKSKHGWGSTGRIVKCAGTPRSYIVEVNGKMYRRNRRNILYAPHSSIYSDIEFDFDTQLSCNVQPDEPMILRDVQSSTQETTQGVLRRSSRRKTVPVWHSDYVMN